MVQTSYQIKKCPVNCDNLRTCVLKKTIDPSLGYVPSSTDVLKNPEGTDFFIDVYDMMKNCVVAIYSRRDGCFGDFIVTGPDRKKITNKIRRQIAKIENAINSGTLDELITSAIKL